MLSVASEIYPFVKTGGLADVVGALPRALAREGIEMRTLVPGYPAVREALDGAETVHTFPDLHGGSARLLAGRAAGLELFALDAPHLYARPGNPYTSPDGKDWPDNARRFAALAQCAAAIARGAVAAFTPQVAHAHDWQAGLVPAYLRFGPRCACKSVLTVHNLAFQGTFPRELLAPLGLPPASFGVDGVEYYGSIGYLKAGIALADRITTVSPTYAGEIRTADAGMGLDGLLRKRADRLSGILNGIDTDGVEPRNRSPHRGPLRSAPAGRARGQQGGAADEARPRDRTRRARLRRGEPAHVAEGNRRDRRGAAGAPPRPHAARAARRG